MIQPDRRSRQRPGVEQQRLDILGAAVSLFASGGSASVSVSAICKQAGVSRDTFYRCFDNKDQLIDTLYRDSISTKMLAVTAADDADFTNPQWLASTVGETVDAILAEHQVASFLFVEAADPASHAHRVIEEAYASVGKSMQDWCNQRHGSSPSLACFTGLLSAAQWLVHRAINRGMSRTDVLEAKRGIEELFIATFTGLAQR